MHATSYWQSRRDLNYYRIAVALAKKYVPVGLSVIDVGCNDCQYIQKIDWLPQKHAIDIKSVPSLPGVYMTKGDFMGFRPTQAYDLVLCLQVLEHLRQPATFAAKLIATGNFVIVSVPFKWKIGKCKCHLQDPVDEAKLQSWFRRPWKESKVVVDGHLRRLIAVFGPNSI